MSEVAVQKIHEEGRETFSLLNEIKTISNKIRERAFELFQHRGRADGFALDDWLQAERDLILAPDADLTEKNGVFEVQVAVPGFEAKDLHVAATPEVLVVNANASSHKHEEDKDNIRFCEFCDKELFRKFDLPSPIDVDKVTANLEDGVLRLTAPKKERTQKPAAVAA